MAAHKAEQVKKREFTTLQNEVSELKSDMSEIKSLLLTLVQKQNIIMTVEKVSQEEMHSQFKERFAKLIEENQQLSAKIKENEVTALKLQGAIETLEYFRTTKEEG